MPPPCLAGVCREMRREGTGSRGRGLSKVCACRSKSTPGPVFNNLYSNTRHQQVKWSLEYVPWDPGKRQPGFWMVQVPHGPLEEEVPEWCSGKVLCTQNSCNFNTSNRTWSFPWMGFLIQMQHKQPGVCLLCDRVCNPEVQITHRKRCPCPTPD